ncbi:hypothetical protein M422DRAFT_776540 [Sphaerobolus stellatus SS14]|nr:hypothetical protein M422DRAFT_776540 [Sphaerobolus stellatus SS14]
MLSFAAPPVDPGPSSSRPVTPDHHSPSSPPASTRSRRYALLPPPPPPPPEQPTSPPIPVRSPLRPRRKSSSEAPSTPSESLPTSKRKHALTELLSSERAYASDLALIRDVHIPLALGFPAPLARLDGSNGTPTTTPKSPAEPPMTKDDARIIFSNIEDIAVFSETFCDKLEEAMQGVLDSDGDGKDTVADVFISLIPYMTPPYTTYITRHSIALAHLNSLPHTVALTAYLSQTRTLAQSYTHAWDLPSLLIKPVQRLLKYPLLLGAIMDDTEPGEAKDKLREARDKVEELARSVNEGRRRQEVVKNLLESKHPPPIRLKSIKGLKHLKNSKDEQLDALEKRLRTCEVFVQDYAKNIVDWSISVRDMISHMERWSVNFGRVIGLGQPHGSEALDLFTEIIAGQITPLWVALDSAIHATLLQKFARLLATTKQPLLLLEHLHALRPQHHQLLDLPISKNRPPNSLVEASQSYLALEVQLRDELPRYIGLLERGFTSCVGQFADWQSRFFREARARWVELWDALGVEGDMSAGAAGTITVWWERWEEIDALASRLSIVKVRRDRASVTNTGPTASLAAAFVGVAPVSPTPSQSLQPLTPLSAHHRLSMHSIDFELERQFEASPDSYTSPSSIHRRNSGHSKLSRKNSFDRDMDKLGDQRRQSEQAGYGGVRKKASFQQRPQTARPATAQAEFSQPSPRVSVHTSSSGSTSSSSNRLSTHSIDVHIGMDMHVIQRPSSRTSHIPPYGSSSLVSASDLVSAIGLGGMPVLPTPPESSRSSRKTSPPTNDEDVDSRGRISKKPSMRQRFSDAFNRSSSKKPSRNSKDSFSSSSIPLPSPSISISDSHTSYTSPPLSPFSVRPGSQGQAQLQIPLNVQALYRCSVVHPFILNGNIRPYYRGRPFLGLQVDDVLEVLSEEGHPKEFDDLPFQPEDDECEECLLLARDEQGVVGWALASFLIIL